ncbi:MAG: hypothetical protein SFV22_14175 [Saprospiraceae bacterium]|nr:hypothetical protein [Saprospiraceae bacterium]
MPTRRQTLKTLATAAVIGAAPAVSFAGKYVAPDTPPMRKGNIRHSVCRWTYGDVPLAEL